MFKLLIVDDEIFTREGIAEQIPFQDLNITDVRQAYDGLNALEVCKNFIPDIILTDVRMPRMDGIELSNKLRKINPLCEIIFMSGYSDKEYLKSAIRLKAVSYVEKPIDLDELQEAIKTAVLSKSKETKLDENIKNNLALKLINCNSNNIEELKLLLEEHKFNELYKSNFCTLLINIFNNNTQNTEGYLDGISDIFSKNNFRSIYSFKNNTTLIMHLYNDAPKKHTLEKENLDSTLSEIAQYLSNQANFFICVGNEVTGINKIHTSYEMASLALNNIFFYNYNSIIYYNDIKANPYVFDENVIINFNDFLNKENKYELILLIKRLTVDLVESKGLSVHYIKDIYYKLYLNLETFAAERKIILEEKNSSKESTFGSFSAFTTIFETENYLIEKVDYVFSCLEKKNINTNPILNIMNFIHEKYADSSLSLQDISENTYLSPAYLCTIFKQHTGTTVNKYLAEYRLKKSKELLSNKNLSITDISSKIGYSNVNYFIKIFKKETGLTPAEYRKKLL